MAVLQLVGLDVQPQRLHDTGSGLGVDAQQPGQTQVQLILGGLGGEWGRGSDHAPRLLG